LDNRLVCDTTPCRLETLPIEYTVYKKTRIIINTILRTSNFAAYWSVSLLIFFVKQGNLFYLRTRILSSIIRFIVMADSAELYVITFYLKSVSTHFCSTYSVKILVSLAIFKEDTGNTILELSDTSSRGTNIGVTSVIQASQQEVTSDSFQIKYVHIVPASFVLFQLGNCTYRWHLRRVRVLLFISKTDDLQKKKKNYAWIHTFHFNACSDEQSAASPPLQYRPRYKFTNAKHKDMQFDE